MAASLVYGTVSLQDGTFRIIDQRLQVGGDLRRQSRGRTCNTYNKKDLVELLAYLQVQPPIPQMLPRPQMMTALQNGGFAREEIEYLTEQELGFLYTWIVMDRNAICAVLLTYLTNQNLVQYV
jgi:hypothetical protein